MYRCEAVSIAGFIQQLAVAYVANGYWFYVTGCIPVHKDPRTVDAKLIERYRIDCSKWVRHRRKAKGLGNVQYLRFRYFFVLLATSGKNELFEQESKAVDIRRRPIQCFGYSIGCYRGREVWHPSVRIERKLFRTLKENMLSSATAETSERIAEKLRQLPFEPYAPVRRQFLKILGTINRARLLAGTEPIPVDSLRLRRCPVLPFQAGESTRHTSKWGAQQSDETIFSFQFT